jgi:probable rRNA maturation factor
MGVEIVNRHAGRRVPIRRLKKTAERILDLLNQNRAELSLALVGNREIRELNARYRNRDEPTDVLSFPSGERLLREMEILGDVVIAVEQAEKQAGKRGRTLEEEVESLLIHGILHLLGYDHEHSKKEAKIMQGMEKKIQQALCGEGKLRV